MTPLPDDDGPLDLFADTSSVGEPPEVEGGEGVEDEREVDRAWTVSELNQTARELLEGGIAPLWVRGEVAGWTRARSGHRYFTLKDDASEVRCVMWRGDASRLPADPEEGMEIRVHGSATVYEARGSFQLVVRQIATEGAEGLWRLAFEKLRRRLELEGLLAPDRKRALPPHPGTVGVVTSATGAALHDIISVIRRRAPWTRVVLRASRVQGEGAAGEVAEAIAALARSGLCDVMIVGRGGGSAEDLWAFNEEVVARAISTCPVPVVSAVGHEVDVTIADLVADLRAPTPSAAAEAVVQDRSGIEDALGGARQRMPVGLVRVARRTRTRIDGGLRGMARAIRAQMLPRLRMRTRGSDDRLARSSKRAVEGGRHRVSRLAATLDALSPVGVLGRGYAVARGEDGSVLRTVAAFAGDRRFRLRVSDGEVPCRADPTEALEDMADG